MIDQHCSIAEKSRNLIQSLKNSALIAEKKNKISYVSVNYYPK